MKHGTHWLSPLRYLGLLLAAAGGGAAMTLVLAVGGGGSAAAAAGEVVRASRFEVVDTAGVAKAVLTSKGGGVGLVLSDQVGKTRIAMGVPPYGVPYVQFSDAAGETRLALMLLPDGSPVLTFHDAAGRVVKTMEP